MTHKGNFLKKYKNFLMEFLLISVKNVEIYQLYQGKDYLIRN